MKKTFNINLGGMIFHIDDDAFNKLEAYLSALREQFASTSGGDEILSDVETRFAELFKERTSAAKEVINIKDVNEAIAIIGEPQDFWQEEEGSSTSYSSNMNYEKRVMRDVDNRVLGGVASGLAAYFNIDVIWVRLLFIALMFAGFGVLLYIILWLVVPAARTTTEKLQMRGKPVTLSNIETFVKDEAHAVGAKMSKLGGDMKNYGSRSGNIFTQFFTAVFDLIKLIFKFFFKLIGFFFLGIGFIVLLSVLMAVFIGIDINDYHYTLFEASDLLQLLSIDSGIYNGLMFGTALLIIGPLFLIIYFGLRLLFSVEPLNKGVRNGLLFSTLLGIVILSISGAKLARQFDDSSTITSEELITAPDGMIRLEVLQDSVYEITDSRHRDEFWSFYDGRSFFTDVEFDIRRSNKDESYLVTNITARGPNRHSARKTANAANHFLEVDSNEITAANYFTIKEGAYYRAHSIKMVLYLAEGDTVFLAPGTGRLIYDVTNVQNYWDGDMEGHYWTMTERGLFCTDCSDTEEIMEKWENQEEDAEEKENTNQEVIIEDDKIIIREVFNDSSPHESPKLALLNKHQTYPSII